MELLPDLATLSDDELRDLIKKLEAEEDQVSYRRRILHGQIDIDRLTEILGGKALPPDDEEEAGEKEPA